MKPTPDRRRFLQTAACAALAPSIASAAGPDWQGEALAYCTKLARPDGGFAWEDQEDSHVTPTFAVVGCFHALKKPVPNADRVAKYVRENHPFRIKKLEREIRVFDYQQIQSLIWLGADASSFKEQVSGWTKPLAYDKRYEIHGNPVMSNELPAFTCRELLGLPTDGLKPNMVKYFDDRRRENGSFNHTPAIDGSDGHVMNTLWGLRALKVMGRVNEKKDAAIAWLQACQRPDGGFTHQPKPDLGGASDAIYTWAAVLGLAMLGAKPKERDGCVAFLMSLRNSDGGFGGRPGWLSNPSSTFHAIEALASLDALASPAPAPAVAKSAAIPANMKVFTIQIESHGKGSPADAVELARGLRIDLWGAKNAKPEWLKKAQAVADAKKVPVRFFTANEEYGTIVSVPGLGTYSHTSDVIFPAGADVGPSLAGKEVIPWSEFRTRRLAPLEKGGGRIIWQFGENDELTRAYMDDSLLRGGYAAISSFHFGNPDFMNSSPFLHHYRGQIPFVGLQDAHGDEPWWFSDMTEGYRTLFLAEAPTWEGWLTALKNNWVAAVRRDGVSSGKLWTHSGSPDVLAFMKKNDAAWRWWNNPAIARPLVSIVALTPEDKDEVGRPDKGLSIRIRCAGRNTTQGLPKEPLVELVKLSVDGAEVRAQAVTNKTDRYHIAKLPDITAGAHKAQATIRVLKDKSEQTTTIEFRV